MAPLSAYLRWFPGERLPLVNGVHMAFGAAGGFLAGGPIDAVLHLVGWRQTFALLAVAIALVCLAIWLIVPPSGDPRKRSGFGVLWR
jgi:predicted MFS family arabinose efflux permease